MLKKLVEWLLRKGKQAEAAARTGMASKSEWGIRGVLTQSSWTVTVTRKTSVQKSQENEPLLQGSCSLATSCHKRLVKKETKS